MQTNRGPSPAGSPLALTLALVACPVEEHPAWSGSTSGSTSSSTSASTDTVSGGSTSGGSTSGGVSSSGSSGSSGGTTCGDGVKDPDEECDGSDVGSATCVGFGFDGGDVACLPGCAYDISGCTGTVTEQRLFISSTAFKGNFGGIAGADAECQARADAASLGGTWLAVLSTSTVDARDRLVVTGIVKNMGGFTLANGADDLWDGIAWAVSFDESGGFGFGDVWTGSNADGTHSGTSCSDFSSAMGTGTQGTGLGSGTGWIANGDGNCQQQRGIYCLEQ